MFAFSIKQLKWLIPVIMLAFSELAAAQATRTWVSGVGDDANPCSRTAPCKTFAGAISKTAAAGEINVIDPGGFGGVTITKSITIDARGVTAGVLVSGTNGIVINAGTTDVVVLRGLNIFGVSGALNGINFLAGKELHVENSTIERFSQIGINARTSTPGSLLFVKDCIIRDNSDPTNGGGILIAPGAGGSMTAFVDHTRLERNKFGIRAEDNSKVTVRDSVASASNVGNGFVALSSSAPAQMFITNSISSGNASAGVYSSGASTTIYISNVSTYNNTQGLGTTSGGQLISFGNNSNRGNLGDGAPTSTIGQQ